MTLLAPSLADMGKTFFGKAWETNLTAALKVSEQLRIWDREPETIPQFLEEEIHNLGLVRQVEIQVMLTQIAATGLNPTPSPPLG